ncbi:S1C family serine protease [Nocardia sp. NEAU-G5]|uniref:S1C family serine protease n=1 Tax=Nocardia albiluteola TaxID=2842303 RepID=A0ABS6B1N6_9NOCA|nr:trypsin-like peptidase domain-containing protein [Nocardia albiluteola]MBU3063371.1 S1C family serine protease [Nocardia albiluteola]
MTVYPNQGSWPGQQPGPYGAPPGPYPPQNGRGPRHGRNFAAVAALVLAVAVGIGLVAGRFAVHETSSIPPMAQSPGIVTQPIGNQTGSADLTAAVNKVVPGIVIINTELGYQNGTAAGTGIVLSPNGQVLTNNHVVEGATKISVTDVGNGKTYAGTVVGYDRTNDMAVVRMSGASGLQTAPLGNSDKISVGDSIVGVGNAGGTGTPTAAAGQVTALNQSVTASDAGAGTAEQLTGLIQVAANIQEGDSGGPLINSAGQVVGIDTAASAAQGFHLGVPGGPGIGIQNGQQTGGQGFAIPINKAVGIAKQIQSGNASGTIHIGQSAFLGVGVADANGAGALVRNVFRGGSAAQAGIVPGDVITGVNGTNVDSATALTNTMDQHHPGDKVTLRYTDPNGQSQSGQVTLAQGPVG